VITVMNPTDFYRRRGFFDFVRKWSYQRLCFLDNSPPRYHFAHNFCRFFSLVPLIFSTFRPKVGTFIGKGKVVTVDAIHAHGGLDF